MNTSFIALGSNLGDPEAQLRLAVSALSELHESRLADCSAVYRSAAVGPGEQPDYLNAVLRLETSLDPLSLLDALQAIETRQGRERDVRWGARTLDLDLILYGRETVASERLTLPHPRFAERNFVLYPLRDVAGDKWVLPDGRELGTLVSLCPQGDLERTAIALGPAAPA